MLTPHPLLRFPSFLYKHYNFYEVIHFSNTEFLFRPDGSLQPYFSITNHSWKLSFGQNRSYSNYWHFSQSLFVHRLKMHLIYLGLRYRIVNIALNIKKNKNEKRTDHIMSINRLFIIISCNYYYTWWGSTYCSKYSGNYYKK